MAHVPTGLRMLITAASGSGHVPHQNMVFKNTVHHSITPISAASCLLGSVQASVDQQPATKQWRLSAIAWRRGRVCLSVQASRHVCFPAPS